MSKKTASIDAEQLRQWQLIERFRQRVEELAKERGVAQSWADPRRQLQYGQYLSLFLFGLFNPALATMRALCAASHLQRVQVEVCGRRVSLGSFFGGAEFGGSRLFGDALWSLGARVSRTAAAGRPPGAALLAGAGQLVVASLAADAVGGLWRRPSWRAESGLAHGQPPLGPSASSAVRLHLGFHLLEDKPVVAQVSVGAICERQAWRQKWQRGAAYVGDRYDGTDYGLLAELSAAGSHFSVRLKEEAVFQSAEELPLEEAERSAGVVRQAWGRLGSRGRGGQVRVVWVETPTAGTLRLVTDLDPATLSAELVARIYRRRWQIECFFRWVKCLLGCRHWLAESPAGVSHQLYLALIAAVLLQQALGRRPNQRMFELIHLYQMGWASLEELLAGLRCESARLDAKAKKY